jgi:hypothetical protein
MELIAVALVVVGFIIFMRIPPKSAKKTAPKKDAGSEVYIMRNGEMYRVVAVEKVQKKPETKKKYKPKVWR